MKIKSTKDRSACPSQADKTNLTLPELTSEKSLLTGEISHQG